MSNINIDLVLPGLLNLPVYELDTERLADETPHLHKLLRFADRLPNQQHTIDAILIHRLGLNQAALPYARACMGDKSGASSILIKPVHLKADINNAIMFPLENSDDIDKIINDLSSYFKENCEIEALPDKSWLMHLHNCKPVVDVPHYLSALGKKVSHYLQQAKTSLQWFKLFNEMQMFLHQHEINQGRQQAGLPVINSLWCWGADAWQGDQLDNTLWFSDDFLMQQLGRLYTGHALPLSALQDQELQSDSIIVELSLLKALKGDSNKNLWQILMDVEKNCLMPLMKSKSHPIICHTAGPHNFHYKSYMAWKVWHKPVRLADLLA